MEAFIWLFDVSAHHAGKDHSAASNTRGYQRICYFDALFESNAASVIASLTAFNKILGRNGDMVSPLFDNVAQYRENYSPRFAGKRVESIRKGYNRMVPRRGLEPPRGCPHQHLKLACLPISPPRQRLAVKAKVSAHYTHPL